LDMTQFRTSTFFSMKISYIIC